MRQIPSTAAPTRRSRSRYSFRAFYITVLIISSFAALSFLADLGVRYHHGAEQGASESRWLEQSGGMRLEKRSEECRLVHNAQDRCAFIRTNCPDEEAGLFSYLSLYYCSLERAQPVAFIILTFWLALLFTTIGIAASDFFCINLSTIASILGMSESMAGVTFLAFGNGSPDVFSTFAAMSSHSGSLAVGELFGAAGFITAVVAGSMALVREFKVGKKTFVRDVGFFIVAASFSMVFLADGALHLWECCVMIGFYLFYVVIVVAWHWYLGRRRKRRERDAAARGQYLATTNEELEVTEEDEDDEERPTRERRYRDEEDLGALERGSSTGFDSLDEDDSDEDEHRGTHLAAEMASNMRVTRPRGTRRNTITPIRPSLVGALEFRSVLSSLQKSRAANPRPIHLRRYSDDTTALNQRNSLGPGVEPYSDSPPNANVSSAEDQAGPSNSRLRAVSMNDAADAKPDPASFNAPKVPDVDIVAATPTHQQHLEVPGDGSRSRSGTTTSAVPPSPTLSITPPPSTRGASRDPSPKPSRGRRGKDARLAPPENDLGTRHLRVNSADEFPGTGSRPAQRPSLQIPTSSSRDSSHSRTMSPVTQFPTYTDSPLPISRESSVPPSLIVPSTTTVEDSLYSSHPLEYKGVPVKWWPYHILPDPNTILATLFPTLSTWHDKSAWDKFASIISAPSIFLLAITLPVVESESQDDDEDIMMIDERTTSVSRTRSGTTPLLVPDSPLEAEEPEWNRYRRATLTHDNTPRSSRSRGYSGHSTASVAVATEHLQHHPHLPTIPSKQGRARDPISPEPAAVSPRDWNRWLVIVQIFTAPLFVVLVVWANTEEHRTGLLVKLILYSLLGSFVALGILIFTTTPSRPPKYRALFCFLGFVVSIAWISTIANEVVGVLKAFGVILGITDAILGLTIFAVGNSLGDLVADITVARLGYPVMALSACFGGPMLNILLGIGVSGLYMTLKEADHKHVKHPNDTFTYKPYQVEVSGTLMVSAVTLLVTLVGLLIAVPMNKWVMSRRIGWGLIILWSISTVINVGVEISGVWDHTSV